MLKNIIYHREYEKKADDIFVRMHCIVASTPRFRRKDGIENDAETKINDAQKLFDLLYMLDSKHGIESMSIKDTDDKSIENKVNTVFLLRDKIEECFDREGQQVSPISLYMRDAMNNDIYKIIKGSGLFNVINKKISKKEKFVYLDICSY